MKERYLITLLLTFAISVSSLAQQPVAKPSQSPSPAPQQTAPGDDDVVRITANLVQVDAVVTDKQGQQVTDLTDQDFEILEDKRPQKISNLSYISIKSATATRQPPAPPPKTSLCRLLICARSRYTAPSRSWWTTSACHLKASFMSGRH